VNRKARCRDKVPFYEIITWVGGTAGGLALVSGPHRAAAEETGATLGLYQIQAAVAAGQPGTSSVWRLNTSTGALDYCTFAGVVTGGRLTLPVRRVLPLHQLRVEPAATGF
jgi:hypothetical protein